jgi:hypothetical protein
MKMKNFWWLRLGVVLVGLFLSSGLFVMPASAHSKETRFRWDIANVNFATGTFNPGGIAIAIADDGSMITLTGHGTFVPTEGFGNHDVTGGGTWKTSNPAGKVTASGTYKVTGFVNWKVAPGTPPLPHDNIGDLEDERAGLAFLTIRYSNGKTGVLAISCNLDPGTPLSVFEGARVSMGFVDYWNGKAPPPPPVSLNLTIFHILD